MWLKSNEPLYSLAMDKKISLKRVQKVQSAWSRVTPKESQRNKDLNPWELAVSVDISFKWSVAQISGQPTANSWASNLTVGSLQTYTIQLLPSIRKKAMRDNTLTWSKPRSKTSNGTNRNTMLYHEEEDTQEHVNLRVTKITTSKEVLPPSMSSYQSKFGKEKTREGPFLPSFDQIQSRNLVGWLGQNLYLLLVFSNFYWLRSLQEPMEWAGYVSLPPLWSPEL